MPLTAPPTDQLTFAVCTFQRVFDTYPAHDLLTLDELVFHLTRFELKPSVLKLLDRDVDRADLALQAYKDGRHRGGWHYSQLTKAAKAIRDQRGTDSAGPPGDAEVIAAVVDAHDKLVKSARKGAKQELRLWAPNLYRPGITKRGTDGVEQLSCLVLDYDEGRRMEQARLIWEPYFHIGHTTWSHTEETHKFRVIMPLASPVRAEDWPPFWAWADELAGPGVDPSCKGVARAYALPVVPNPQWPRSSWVNRAPLLDPLSEGLVPVAATPRPVPIEIDHPSWFRESDEPTHYVESETPSSPTAHRDDSLMSAAEPHDPWNLFDSPTEAARASALSGSDGPLPDERPTEPAVQPSTDTSGNRSVTLDRILELLDRIASRLGNMERTLSWMRGLPQNQLGLTGQLERLHTLYEDGALTDEEFTRAKALLLDDDLVGS